MSDRTRQGALRFASNGNSVGDNVDVPKLISLPELLGAADSIDNTDGLAAVKTLLDAGSGSLGGARPKASVIDNDGRLAIAKFPKPDDPYDVVGWEKTALDLAEAAGISVPARRIERIGGRSVLIIDRFDRDDNGARRQTAICGAYGIGDEESGLAMLASQCGLSPDASDQIAAEVAQAVAGWRAAATANRISESDSANFAPAFTAGLDIINR